MPAECATVPLVTRLDCTDTSPNTNRRSDTETMHRDLLFFAFAAKDREVSALGGLATTVSCAADHTATTMRVS